MPATGIDREPIYEALKAALVTGASPEIKTVVRRLPAPDAMGTAQWPVCGLVLQPETRRQDKGSPSLLTLRSTLVIMMPGTAEAGAVKQTAINKALRAVDRALAPDPLLGWNDLGGLVAHCWIEGDTLIDEGLATRPMYAGVPVNILVGRDGDGSDRGFWFDAGALYATPGQAVNRGGFTDQTPVRFAALKGLWTEHTTELGEASTPLQFPVLPIAKKRRVGMRAMIGCVDGKAFSEVAYGTQWTSGGTHVVQDQPVTVPGGLQVTAAPPAGGTYAEDLGVLDQLTGARLTKVTTVTAADQYSLAGAVYSFHADDANRKLALSFLYTTTKGSNLLLANTPADLAPTFSAVLHGKYNGRDMTAHFPRCAGSRITAPAQLERFLTHELEFEAYTDATGAVGTISFT